MLLVIVGTDATLRAKKRRALVSLTTEELVPDTMDISEVEALATTLGLFGEARAFLVTNGFLGERGEDLLVRASVLVKSPHTFVFEEEKLLKKPTELLTKAGAKIETVTSVKKERGFDPFNLTGSFALKDKKGLWLGLSQALAAGEKPEAIAGLLHWKVRDMLGSGRAGKFGAGELRNASRSLVKLYHDSHRGAGDLGFLLERYILSL